MLFSLSRWVAVRLFLGLLGMGVLRSGQAAIPDLPTSEAAILGRFARGPINEPILVTQQEFSALFSGSPTSPTLAEIQVGQFFAHGGKTLHVVRISPTGTLRDALLGESSALTGLYSLSALRHLRIAIAPELSLLTPSEFSGAFALFQSFLNPRHIFFIVDPAPSLTGVNAVIQWVESALPADTRSCALYYPNLQIQTVSGIRTVGACGAMAGIYSQVDAAQGIWRSPAGTGWNLQAVGLSESITTVQSELLNAHQISAIRAFAGAGIVPWGARTLNRLDADRRYIPVVRTRDWITSSLERGLAYSAQRDNAPALWAELRGDVESFLLELYRQRALVGSTPQESFFVRCDQTTTSANDIAQHQVRVIYGLALLRPAEFDFNEIILPTYWSSRPAPAVVAHAGLGIAGLVVAFPSAAGFLYRMEESVELGSESWRPVVPEFPGDGSWFRGAFPTLEDHGLYRVRVTPIR